MNLPPMMNRDAMEARQHAIRQQNKGPLRTRGIDGMIRNIERFSAALTPEEAQELAEARDVAAGILRNPDAMPDEEANAALLHFKTVYRVLEERSVARSDREARPSEVEKSD